jgi:hypothetical protein
MSRSRINAVCGTCAWRPDCRDAEVLEQFRSFLDNSRAASEFSLLAGARYRLGCERYRYKGTVAREKRPPLRLVVVNNDNPTTTA